MAGMVRERIGTGDWARQLQAGASALGLSLDQAQQVRLLDYLGLLDKWNRVYNLTAVRAREDMVRRQLLDSLAILPWVDDGPVLDVGTGAGLPGIPLAIARPDLAFVLLDTNGKKTRFVQQAATELGLANVEVARARVEDYARAGGFARITTRAFATLADTVAGSAHLLARGGCWLAMKGAAPGAELRQLPPGLAARVEMLAVPGEAAARHLVRIEPA
jgi:16S rRNA (guanine527-N7)-methyltransferase